MLPKSQKMAERRSLRLQNSILVVQSPLVFYHSLHLHYVRPLFAWLIVVIFQLLNGDARSHRLSCLAPFLFALTTLCREGEKTSEFYCVLFSFGFTYGWNRTWAACAVSKCHFTLVVHLNSDIPLHGTLLRMCSQYYVAIKRHKNWIGL